ncbi:uncharacterized protein LAESUDRAFT_759915 [Laetiporus sulphureus 93-53]|uniref:Uncharacterized protein n=1 Tax=Laetiporus sulphureus 93-53 TaxID=1314785 RepID=A0A165DUV0_9APHY|nr:uncharacterized protein LAESUDRAFT_759915 [Laetiporus sulphureus 93-53]KZT05670.1 hypothetical protein LAESUDRAFT_759915 [Laetiporus sulphureus 93-53]
MCPAPLTPRSGSVLASSSPRLPLTSFIVASALNFQRTKARARSTSYQPPPPSFTTGFSPSTTTEFSPFSTTRFSPLKSILQASHIRHARTPSPDHNGLRASERMQNTAMGQRRRSRRASRWVSGSGYVGQSGRRAGWDAMLGEPSSFSPFYSVPVRALASLTTTACKHAVSFVRRYHIPRTERDDSIAYGHAIIAVNVASRTRARLQGRPTVASGAAAGGRGGDLTERVGGRERT